MESKRQQKRAKEFLLLASGAWSDGSKEWKDNPLIKMVLRPKTEDDGTFWMPWEDFSQLFTKAHRQTSLTHPFPDKSDA
eukprot:6207216-Pleurochrysis_carterae.AAC.1